MLEKLEKYKGFVIRARAHRLREEDIPVSYWGECYRAVVTIAAAGPNDETFAEETIEVPQGAICIDRHDAMLTATRFGRHVVDRRLGEATICASPTDAMPMPA